MSALPNPLHTQKKAPAIAARPSKLNQHGRDPQSPGERLRDSSNYDTGVGYAPLFHAFTADWPRLQSGVTSCLLRDVVLGKSLGRSVKKGEPRPVRTLPLAVSELAALCSCDERSIQRELAGWHLRKIADVKAEGKGLVSVELLYRGWEALPDYKNVVSIETGAPVEDDTPVDAEKAQATRIELTKAPVPCKAGGRSKGVKIDCGVTQFHVVNPSAVDFEITGMVQAGDLGITIRATEEWLRDALKRTSVPNGINNLDSPPRHGRHGVESKPTAKLTSKAIDYTHPRAAELNRIFDPILAHSGASLLSMDSSRKFCLEACQKIQDCDHDYLAKFVANRSKIKSVVAVPDICAQALASWRASKVLDGAGLKAAKAAPIYVPPVVEKDDYWETAPDFVTPKGHVISPRGKKK